MAPFGQGLTIIDLTLEGEPPNSGLLGRSHGFHQDRALAQHGMPSANRAPLPSTGTSTLSRNCSERFSFGHAPSWPKSDHHGSQSPTSSTGDTLDPVVQRGDRDASSRAAQLHPGLQTPASKSRHLPTHQNRREPNGSPMGDLNQSLLKRVRETLGSASESQPRKKPRVSGLEDHQILASDRDVSRSQHDSRSKPKLGQQRNSFYNREYSPVDLLSDSPPGHHGRSPQPRNGNQISGFRDDSSATSPHRMTGEPGKSFSESTSRRINGTQPAVAEVTKKPHPLANAAPGNTPESAPLGAIQSSAQLGPGELESRKQRTASLLASLKSGSHADNPAQIEESPGKNGESPGAKKSIERETSNVSSAHQVKLPIRRSPSQDRENGWKRLSGASENGQGVIEDAQQANEQLQSEAVRSMAGEQVHRPVPHAANTPSKAAATQRLPIGTSLGKHVETVLQSYLDEYRTDNEYWTKTWLNRARCGMAARKPSQTGRKAPFKSMKPLPFTVTLSKSSPKANVWGMEDMNSAGKPLGKPVYVSAPCSSFGTEEPDIPTYAHYVSIENNILAPNVTTLKYWPYFGEDDAAEAPGLKDHYDLDIVERERKITQLLKANQYLEYATSALRNLDCSWTDVLRFLLETHPVPVGLDKDVMNAVHRRHEYCDEDFTRSASRWSQILATLPPSDSEKIGRVALLCLSFQKLTKFSLWHLARMSDHCKLPVKGSSPTDLTCRICLLSDCPFHGEMKDAPDEDKDGQGRQLDATEAAYVVNTDIVNPPNVNYRTRVDFPPPPPNENLDKARGMEEDFAKGMKIARNRHAHHWAAGSYKKADERGPFYPCYHPETSCEDANCSCFRDKIPCEKICGCPPDCARRFPGCSCGMKHGKKLVCFQDTDCPCYQSGRECDPDLCRHCGVCEVMDPVNRGSEDILQSRCRNASLQRGIPKHTIMGDSGIHGLGLYACEDIREDDFVGEYVGEIILKEEADRRGAVYEIQGLSYLFTLNTMQEIDSTYFGSKTRFINHASQQRANLRARITLVNTVHRIGMYAERHIKAGEELFFDYGPAFPDEQLGGKKARKAAPHVRNMKLVDTFYDVSTHKDKLGNIRAHKTSKKTAGRSKGSGAGVPASAKARSEKGQHLKITHRRPRIEDAEEDAEGDGPIPSAAGRRLVAFNISDETSQDTPSQGPADGEAEDSEEDFIPDEDWNQGASDGSGADDEEDGDDEDRVVGPGRRRGRRRT